MGGHPAERTRLPNPAYVTETTAFAVGMFPDLLACAGGGVGGDGAEEGGGSGTAGEMGGGAGAGVAAEGADVQLEDSTCLYTMTRDGNFVIDWVPPKEGEDEAAAAAAAAPPRVLLLAGFSGAGYKHAPLVGKLAAEMVQASLAMDMPTDSDGPSDGPAAAGSAGVGGAPASGEARGCLLRRPPSFPDLAPFSITRPGLYASKDDAAPGVLS